MLKDKKKYKLQHMYCMYIYKLNKLLIVVTCSLSLNYKATTLV